MSARTRGRPRYDDVLTPAEWRIVHAVQHGMSNREIATRRGLSVDAVRYHLGNVYAKLGVRNREELRHWFRAPKRSALAGREKQVRADDKLGAIGQISRSVRDIGQAVRWYGEVLGLPHLYTFGPRAFFDCGGTRLYLEQTEGEPPHESVLYLRVEDIQAACAALEARGVEFMDAAHLIHRHADGMEEWMAFFKDPEGRPLALMAQVRPQRGT